MAQYSIKELEHLSGIKAHTIRIWEQRYEILKPKRTETNIRFYDDADLRALLNISLLNENGYKISRIAKMSDKEISAEVLELVNKKNPCPQQIHSLLLAMIEMDEARYDKILTTIILQRGLERTMLEIVCPFFAQTGILWQTGNISPAQEHFVSSIIKQKLYVAIDGQIATTSEEVPRFILYLPEGELHEMGLLFSNYVLRSRGFRVMYLGQNLPFTDLEACVSFFKPHYICTAFTAVPEREQVQANIDRLVPLASEILIFVGGNQAQYTSLVFPENIHRISSLPEFIQRVDSLKLPVL